MTEDQFICPKQDDCPSRNNCRHAELHSETLSCGFWKKMGGCPDCVRENIVIVQDERYFDGKFYWPVKPAKYPSPVNPS